ncbi:hypothetical protein KC349_g313 [Hortaea werneckii]|nr:hypothetical protein KC349_g313 [Hortaea werneckii]
MSTVRLVVARSIRKTSLFSACFFIISLNIKTSSTIKGTRLIKWLAANPGLKADRHFFHSTPSLETMLPGPPIFRMNFSTSGCFGRLCLTVNWFMISASKIIMIGSPNGHGSTFWKKRMIRVAMTTVTAQARRLGVSSSSIFARIQRYRFEASMFTEEKERR